MFEFIFDNISPIWIIFQIILINSLYVYFIFGISVNRKNVISYTKVNYSTNILVSGCILFCIFASYDGDFFHYRKIINEIFDSSNFIPHMETPYVLLVTYLTKRSYLLFRIIVWGIALFIYKKAFSKLGVDNSLMWCAFIFSTIINIAFIRGFLAYSIFFYGYALLNSPSTGRFQKFNGIILLLSSIFFHKSMIVLILLSIVASFKFQKRNFIIYILLIPVVLSLLNKYFLPYIGFLGRDWVKQNTSSFGIGYNLFNYISYFVVTIILWQLAPGKRTKINAMLEKCWHLSILIIYAFVTITIFSITNKIGGMYFSNRIFLLIYCLVPFLLYNQLKNRKKGTINVLLITLCVIATNYRLLYAYYLQSSGVGI